MGENWKFGGGGETLVHPAILCVIMVGAVLIFLLPRRKVIWPLLAMAMLLPMDQLILVGPFHFHMLRVVILLGLLRIIQIKFSTHCQFYDGETNAIDKCVVLFTVSKAVSFILLWPQWGAFINQLGFIYNVLGMYFLLRFLIRDVDDVTRTFRVLVYVSIPVAVIMLMEQKSGQSFYATLGRPMDLVVRNGRVRSAGPFLHPIMAGVFGGTSLAFFIGLWLQERKHRIEALLGCIAATVIVYASNASTPVLSYGSVVLAFCLWPLRGWLYILRRALVVVLIFLHIVMKAPVWALIARIDLVGMSSGYQRYMLIDQFIVNFGEWWMLGTKSNENWGHDMWDVTNQYVAVGVNGGLVSLVFFIAILVYGFRYLGRAMRASYGDKGRTIFFWVLGSALFSHTVTFIGASYFDQIKVVWFALLVMIASSAGTLREKIEVHSPQVGGKPAGHQPFAPDFS